MNGKQFRRVLKWLLGIVFILLLLLILLSQLKPVQNLLLQRAISSISERTHTEITLGEIYWRKLGRLDLEQVLIRDLQSDTLLAVDQLHVRLKPFRLLKRRLELEEVTISGVLARISKNEDQQWNYAFLVDAFGSTPSTESKQTKSPAWSIQANDIQLSDIRLEYLNAIDQQEIKASWKKLLIEIEELDPDQQVLHVGNFHIDQPDLQYFAIASAADTATITPPTAPGFPDLGWDISVQQLSADDGQLIYQLKGAERSVTEGFDPTNLHLQELNWEIDSVRIGDQAMRALIQSFAFKDQSAFEVRNLKAGILFSDAALAVQNFDLSTPHSRILHSVQVDYPSFEELMEYILQPQNGRSRDIQLQLALAESRLSPKDIQFIVPGLLASGQTAPFLFQAQMDGNLNQLKVKTLSLQQGSALSFQSSGSIGEFLNTDDLHFDLAIETLQVQYDSLLRLLANPQLPEGLQEWGPISAKGRLSGKLSDLSLSGFQFRSVNGPRMAADIRVEGMPDYQNAAMELKLDQLQTKSEDWRALAGGNLPSALDSLGQLTLSGIAKGTISDFQTDLRINSKAGNLVASTTVNFSPDFSDASYDGRLELKELQLGKITGNTQLGTVDLTAFINGQGIQAEDLNTTINGYLHQLDYQGYVYDTLLYEADLADFSLKGNLQMADPNLRFIAEGQFPLDRGGSDYQLHFILDTINLQPLRFTNTPMGIRTRLSLDLESLNLDSLQGQLALTDFIIQNELVYYRTDSLSLRSGFKDQGKKQFIISSDLLQLNLEGQYKWQDLPSTLFTFTNQYFPLAQAFFPEGYIRTNALDSTRFQAHFTISDPTPLTQIILPDLKALDTFDLQLSFEGAEDQWELTAKLPKFHYSDVRLDTLQVYSKANANRFNNQIKASRLELGANNTFFHPSIEANLGDSTLNWEIKSYENIEEPLWQIAGQVISHQVEWQLLFDTSLLLEAQPWTINPDHIAQFRWGEDWNIDRLQFKQTESSFLQLDGRGSFIDSSSNAFLSFQQFDIDIISPFLDYPPDYLDGILNGKFSVKDFLRKPNFSASLDLQEWSVDSVLIGNLSLNARKVTGQPLIEVASDLGGHGNELNIKGQFDINQQQFSTKSTIQRLDLETLDPFLTGLVHNSKGFLSGNFSAEGKINQPIVKGNLQFNDVTTTIDYVNTPYTFTEGKLSFTENQISFENISLLDADGYEATLRGAITHQYFDDIAMDLNFNTDRFRFLNTTAKDNDLFYGRLILASDINIQGPIDQPRFFINAKTQPNTNFYVVPLTDEQAISREDFIIYGQPALDSMGRDTNYLNNYQVKAPGIDLRLNLEMTPDAALEIIMDPLTGDKLTCEGRSNLSVNMNPAGDVNISGTFEITEGSYSFSFEQLIQRNFNILPNSKIIFNGDPLQAELDITTSYQVRVPLSDLVESQLTSDTRLIGLRADVKVLMKISGNLIQPELDFDIILVGDAQGATVDAAQTRLQQLRSSETELNKQVFGLLLFNSFIREQGGSQSFADAGESVVLSSVSKLVSNQLNRLADQYIKGIDLSLGLESYRPGVDPTEEAGVTTEVQLDVSKRLFNDRLNVKIGGNVNVGASDESQALSAFSSDFVLEYRLNPSGGTLLRVYRRNDFDALNEGNVIRTGAGISIKKTLENKKRKRKHE